MMDFQGGDVCVVGVVGVIPLACVLVVDDRADGIATR